MQAIVPQTLNILNNSVPEDDAPAWDDSAMYAVGDRVIDNHYVYRSVVDDNQGNRPSDGADVDGAPWRTVSVTNKYACIDLYSHTQTVASEGAAELVIQVPFTRPATAVALLNMKAVSVTATLTDSSGSEAWTSGERSLLQDSIDWWDYFFGLFLQREDIVFVHIPPVTGTLTITLEGDRPAIGNIIVGEAMVLGQTLYGVETGFIDYSVNTVDSYGNEVWVKRRNAKRGTFPFWFPPSQLDYVQKTMARLSGVPALWIGDNGTGYESLVMFGFAKEYTADVEAVSYIGATLELRGIV